MCDMPLFNRTCYCIFIIFFSCYSIAQTAIRIGAPLPLTGQLALEAAKQKRGYELWADMVNQQGGIQVAGVEYPVELIYIDYQSESSRVRAAVESLVDENKVHLLFAPYGSMAAREASAVAQKNRVPMIAITASSRQAYSRGHKYIFGLFTPNETLIDSLMEVVLNAVPFTDRLALLVRKDLFSLSLSREVKTAAEKQGLNIVFFHSYATDESNHSLALTKLKQLQPDWVFALGYTEDLIQLRRQMAGMEITTPLLTMIAAPAYQEFIDSTGPLSENITSAAWWHPSVQYAGEHMFGLTKNYVDLFQRRYGTLPDYVEATASLAGVLFQVAIERANRLHGPSIREELVKMDEVTFWGPVRFGVNGQNNALKPLVFQIQQRRPVVIFPFDIATGKLRLGIR